MNSYEAKQADRRNRMAERAARLRSVADVEYRKADLREEASGIPLGQPIIIGHHSEGRHRRAIERADNAMRRSIEATRKAQELERRAASPSTAISSDDPDACQKLRAKIEKAQQKQAAMKDANKLIRAAYKRGVRDANSGEYWAVYLAKIREIFPGIEDATAARLLAPDVMGGIGYQGYQLTNNAANIRRMEQRLKTLEKNSQAETRERAAADGLRVVENIEENRVQMIFDGKPDADTRQQLKARGFRWAPSQGAWQRHLNNAGRHAADCVVTWLASRSADAEPISATV